MNLLAGLARRLVAVLSSYALACVVLFFLAVLTFFATLESEKIGVHATERIYFSSWLVWRDLGAGISVPVFPGGQLLMATLFFNLLVGGIIRIKKGLRTLGVIVGHLGILGLLFTAFVEQQFAQEGKMVLREGEVSNEYDSYHDWEVAIQNVLSDGRVREWVVPQEDFQDLVGGRRRTFRAEDLPFELEMGGYLPNCVPRRAGPHAAGAGRVVDAFVLSPRPRAKDAAMDIAGLHVVAREKDSGRTHEALLWGFAERPWVITVGGEAWGVQLRHRLWRLPFAIRLEKFTRELHPRSGVPKWFSSDVVKLEDGLPPERVTISMNRPLRHAGYVFYQESFGPQGRRLRPGESWWSQLAVARNPSDRWPIFWCAVIAIGLTVHFLLKLRRYIANQSRSISSGVPS